MKNKIKIYSIGAGVLLILAIVPLVNGLSLEERYDIDYLSSDERIKYVPYELGMEREQDPNIVYYNADTAIVFSVSGQLQDCIFSVMDLTGCICIDSIEKSILDTEISAALFEMNNMLPDEFISLILDLPLVVDAELNTMSQTCYSPNDDLFKEQYGPKLIGCQRAWNKTLGSHTVTVAVIDSGIDYDHPDIAPNYPTWSRDNDHDFAPDPLNPIGEDDDPLDELGHGTHCAGIIAAQINNAEGIAGIANVQLMSVKAFYGKGWAWQWNVARGILWAADHGADVISMSFGGRYSLLEQASCAYAAACDIVLVAAAGNEGEYGISYPARYATVIAVGAVDGNKIRPSWSSRGPALEFCAPGVNVLSTMPRYHVYMNDLGYSMNYDECSGTSMAAPHVAGSIALYLSYYEMSAIRVRLKHVQQSSDREDLGLPGRDDEYGFGLIRADTVIDKAKSKTVNIPSDLEFKVSTNKDVYRWKADPIHITLSIENKGDTNKVFTFPTAQQNDFKVGFFFGWQLFQWSEGKDFEQVITTLTISPGETVSWDFTWNQEGHLFKFLPIRQVFPGTYYITGQIPSTDITFEDTAKIRLRLK